MILDRLQNANRYSCLNPGFERAFEFLRRRDLAQLAPGRHEIDGDRVYALVIKGKGRRKDEVKLETHRKYIDIQFVISGADEMGWTDLGSCRKTATAYDAAKDIEFFADAVESWTTVNPGAFAIYFPEDAHAPMVGGGEIHKIVVKVICTQHGQEKKS